MKKQLFQVIMLVAVLAVSLMATGCASQGLSQDEVHRRHVDAWDTQMLQFQDSFDAFWMIDQPPRTSSMYIR